MMRLPTLAALAAVLAPAALALPFKTQQLVPRQLAPSTDAILVDFPIHDSCNASQQIQLKKGFADMRLYAQTALDHLLHYGHNSPHAKLYFGNATDISPAVGYYTRLLSGDKTGLLFRCDDPDGNCALPDYGGHWRGENASDETVICDLSFQTRLPIEKTCSNGFQLGTDKVNIMWGVDLLHRVLHLPKITDEGVTHVADSYFSAIELAAKSPKQTVSNQNTLQSFAFDVFSRTLFPNGCIGTIKPDDGHVEGMHAPAPAPATPAVPAANNTTATPPPVVAAPVAGAECHFHANGERHCS